MDGKATIAFVTGANRGIGLETARGLGELGIAVLLGSRDPREGEKAARTLRDRGVSSVEPVEFDVRNREHHRRVASMLEDGPGHLDILVNNAGIQMENLEFGGEEGFNDTSTVSEAVLRETFEVNFFAVVALTQTLLPLIRRAGAGRIVNVSSVLASLELQSNPRSAVYGAKMFAYDASKTALNAFTVHLAAELRRTNVKVNSAHPGWVKTALGGPAAPVEVSEGGRTSVQLATLPDDGPTGGYFHLGERLPW